MIVHDITPRAFFSSENYEWLESLIPWNEEKFKPISQDMDVVGFCAELAGHILDGEPHEFQEMLVKYEVSVLQYLENEEIKDDFARLLKLGLEYGVAAGDWACATYLGGAYYMGTFVEQDYQSAKDLYEIAESKGSIQAMINLGYIYEYGRTGELDYNKAYYQYAKAAALGDAAEALYKLGDMYARGYADSKDPAIAFFLYEKSLDKAEGSLAIAAQPAIRLAKMLIEEEYRDYEIPFNPMKALELFQLAERGLRVDIAMGQTFYKKRLLEALEGQEKARALVALELDNDE